MQKIWTKRDLTRLNHEEKKLKRETKGFGKGAEIQIDKETQETSRTCCSFALFNPTNGQGIPYASP